MAKNCRGPRILVIGKQPHQIKWTKRRRWSHKLEISLFLSRSRQARVKGFSSGRKNRPLLFSPLPLTGSHKTRRWGWRVEGAPDCASVATRAMERATCFSRVRQLEPALFTAVYLPSLNATPSPIYIYTYWTIVDSLYFSFYLSGLGESCPREKFFARMYWRVNGERRLRWFNGKCDVERITRINPFHSYVAILRFIKCMYNTITFWTFVTSIDKCEVQRVNFFSPLK